MSNFSTQISSCLRCSRSFTPMNLSPTSTTVFCLDCLSNTSPPQITLALFLIAFRFVESNETHSYVSCPIENNETYSYVPRPPPTATSFINTLKKDKLFVSRSVLKQMIAAPSCAICSDEFQLKEHANQLSCRHWFPHDCIRKWLSMKNNCPLCRHEFPREPDHHVLRSPLSEHPVPTATMMPENSTATMVVQMLPPRRVHRTARIQAGAILPNRRLAESE